MTPDELSEIEQRAVVAKSVTGDDPLEAWGGWSDDMQCMTYDVRGDHETYAVCVAEETAELVIHAPGDIDALVAEVRRLRGVLQDLADYGTRHDLNPTQMSMEGNPVTWWLGYLESMDNHVRGVARSALEAKEQA